MENSLDNDVGEKRKRGRPPNLEKGKNKGGGRRRMSAIKAKQLQRANQANPRHKKAKEAKKRCSERIFELKKTENRQFWNSYPCPERQGQNLSQDQIDTAIRLIYKMREEGQAEVMERASSYLDISDKTLYILWRTFLKTGVVPHSLRGQKRKIRMKLVSTEWVRPIQEEMERIRLQEGRAVEVPDILKWLQDTHEITISACQLRYRLSKMGFVFSKGQKLTLKKEDPRIRRLRQEYLKRRHEYDKIINENNERYYLLRQEGLPLDGMKEIVYIYLDESYVNRYYFD